MADPVRIVELGDANLPLLQDAYVMVDSPSLDGAQRVLVEDLGVAALARVSQHGRDGNGETMPPLPGANEAAMKALLVRVARLEQQLGLTGEV